MNRTFVLSAVLGGLILGTLALPAAAATSVTVNVANLDPKAAHERIVEAARQVCNAEFSNGSMLQQHYDVPACIADTTDATEAALASRKSTLARL